MSVTRTPACRVKGCPAPRDPDWHVPICGHGLEGHHHHVTKRSQGGKDGPQVFICPKCHDNIDNGEWGNNVTETYQDGQKVTMYRAWDLHNTTLIERPVLSAAAESGHGGDETQRTGLTMKKPLSQSLGSTEGSAAAPSAGVLSDGDEAAKSGSIISIGRGDEGEADLTLPRGSEGTIKPESVATHTLPPSPSAPVLSDGAEEGNAPPQGADVELSASAPSLSTKEESDGTESGTDRGGAAHVCERVESSGKKAALDRRPVLDGVSTGIGRSDTVLALTHDQRVAIAQAIKGAQQQRQFFAGDTANLWEEELGEDFWNRWANEFGYTYPTLRNVMRVCKAIPPNQRHNEMSFAHHEAVKTFDIETREAWLERSFDEEWPVKRLREELVTEGLLTTKPRVKRWSSEELHAEVAHYGTEPQKRVIHAFIDFMKERA